MNPTHFRMFAFVAALAVLPAAGGCRKARPPAPPPGEAGAAAGPAADAGAAAEPELGARPPAEADWAGLSDEEAAERSGITLEECRLALAEGDGIRITVCDFIREVNALPPRYRSRFDSLERRKELLEDMISLAVMEQEAKRLGLDRDPETRFYLERLLADKMEAELKAELRKEIRQTIAAQDEEAYFATHQDQFNRPELASAAHILVATEAEAQALIVQLTAPDVARNLFATLAAERSLDADTKARGGSLSYFTRPDVHSDRYPAVDPALAAVVFEMQNIGDVYPQPVRTTQGFHVLKLTGKRAAVVRALEQVRPAVRAGIEEERFQAAWKQKMQAIQAELGVELHPENLADVQPTLPSPEELERTHHVHQPPAPPGPAGAAIRTVPPPGPSNKPLPAPEPVMP
ncbi:MAG: peptidylprolyl isomerase [Deltaproteobacteria bacterium]|nr:peptidylprolyl isomerase [Deltaproteobacteria bacterium]